MSGSKSSLHIGCNYRGTSYELRGCIRDANNMASFLRQHCGYRQENITIMTDDTPIKPTRDNILAAIRTLILDPSTIKTLTYSGHGSRVVDRNNDERDGWDETWVSCDLENILDDDLRNLLELLPSGKVLYIVSDSCHSGTIMDLPFSLSNGTRVQQNNTRSLPSSSIYCLSGCLDDQYSYETTLDNQINGAMTWALIRVLSANRRQSPKSIIDRVLILLKQQKLPQTPLWSSSSRPQPQERILFFG
jgi:hypothetical protein